MTVGAKCLCSDSWACQEKKESKKKKNARTPQKKLCMNAMLGGQAIDKDMDI